MPKYGGRTGRFLEGLKKLCNQEGVHLVLYDAVDEGFVLEEMPEGQRVREFYKSYVHGEGVVIGERLEDVEREKNPICLHYDCELFKDGQGEIVCALCQYRAPNR